MRIYCGKTTTTTMTHQEEIAESLRLLRVRKASFIDQANAVVAALLAAAASDERVAAAIADSLRTAVR